jgi:predicted Zn-dependent protease
MVRLRRSFPPFVLVAALLLGGLVVGCQMGDKAPAGLDDPEDDPTAIGSPPPGVEPQVYLQGVGEFPKDKLTQIQDYFWEEHAIVVGVLDDLGIPDEALDYQRRQVVADAMLDVIDAARPSHLETVVVIGVTEYDIMTVDRPDWAFVFSLRDTGTRTALISTARMDPRSFGLRRDDELMLMRASKMIAKSIGIMVFGLPESNDPRSVMYNRLYSLDALDYVDDDFELGSRASAANR